MRRTAWSPSPEGAGAQCDGADPLDHGQSSPVLFPRAESVAALPVSLFSVKALAFFRRKVVQAGNLKGICGLSRCPVLAAVLAGIGFAGRAVVWILRYSGVALVALWLIWIKGPIAIERLDLATALASMAYPASSGGTVLPRILAAAISPLPSAPCSSGSPASEGRGWLRFEALHRGTSKRHLIQGRF